MSGKEYQRHLNLVKTLIGTKILDAQVDGNENLILKLDNDTTISVNYDCKGGVTLYEENNDE